MTGREDLLEVVLPGRVGVDGFRVGVQVQAEPAAGAVTLRMEATGVSYAEQQMRQGRYFDQPTFPFVPGYDVVGTAVSVGEGVDPALLGQRFAAVTKIGAWASMVEVAQEDLLTVDPALDPVDVATLIVNGITAWQMLHVGARVSRGDVIVVLGANGGVGNTLVQLARHAGVRVIGTASARHHDMIRSLGADVVDYHAADAYDQIKRLAPEGVDAVFDHVGGDSLRDSFALLRRGGTLVSYGTASTKDTEGNPRLPILRSLGRIVMWNALPNGRSARMYNLWAGRRNRRRFNERQQEALTNVLTLVSEGAIRPQVAARFPLSEIVSAVELAESRTAAGKVVLVPEEAPERMDAPGTGQATDVSS